MSSDPIVRNMPGIKEGELDAYGPCPVCRQPLLTKGITFYEVTIRRAALDRGALERRIGLGMMLGGHQTIARIMGPDEDLAKVFAGPVKVAVHEDCAATVGHLLELWPESPDEPASDDPSAGAEFAAGATAAAIDEPKDPA